MFTKDIKLKYCKLLSSIKADNTTYFGNVAISPDGKFVASIVYSPIDKSIGVGLWNSKTGEAIWKKPIVTNSAEFPSQSDFEGILFFSSASSRLIDLVTGENKGNNFLRNSKKANKWERRRRERGRPERSSKKMK